MAVIFSLVVKNPNMDIDEEWLDDEEEFNLNNDEEWQHQDQGKVADRRELWSGNQMTKY